ncbi:uncharacterized protein STEHIDRAFT_140034 [Stereum hirsutum FP-91666 SS1]|uniref:uncharacterized protein n=1 Tax=Stereum hirsutum (strain FP-91666) TaxID=721885 RepID=UPI000444923F|nr:uncharacterized protein STEHIDRAFT_140034 [Stereum hirsutum FP-91666 SS1]EIM85316.1 hypothetical protein STEHIDRAFT_140034 [Stereum hirsutum FP-91666 SS1]
MAAPATPPHASAVDKGPFCLVTQDPCPVQALARVRFLDSADKDQIAKWKTIWGPDFDLDSPLNTVWLRKDWAATLEAHLWTLIPVQLRLEKTLTALLQWKAKRLRPTMNDICPLLNRAAGNTYYFTLLPLKLNNYPIIRTTRTAETLQPTGEIKSYKTSSTTFKADFPSLSCTLHPFFVIHGALAHFHAHLGNPLHLTVYAQLATIINLWEGLLTYPKSKGSSHAGTKTIQQPKRSIADVEVVVIEDDEQDNKASLRPDTSEEDVKALLAGPSSINYNTRTSDCKVTGWTMPQRSILPLEIGSLFERLYTLGIPEMSGPVALP